MGVGDARACLCVCVVGGGGVIVVQHFMKYFVWTLISPQIYGVFLKRERIKVLKVSLSALLYCTFGLCQYATRDTL